MITTRDHIRARVNDAVFSDMRAVCAVVFFISGFMKKDLFFPDRFLFHFSFLMGLLPNVVLHRQRRSVRLFPETLQRPANREFPGVLPG